MNIKVKEMPIAVSEGIGSVSTIILTPPEVEAALVLAHGAGAGMKHKFMEALAVAFAEQNIATIRYNFPYVEHGRKRPDAPGIAEKTVEMVIEYAHKTFPNTPLFAGGKSFGGRMTSQLLARNILPYVKGVVFFGFPLHPSGAPSTERAKHLPGIKVPMLFLQGTRDTLADMTLMEPVVKNFKKAKLVKFEGADHSFNQGKVNLIPLLVEKTESWMSEVIIS